ncbi:NUDIX hydrolase [Pseudoalteromonas phage J2-1_QLiu-2017]|nr:NUDIX hydrolase [Pseudoalteromonas phage J2-1_QLiu-2017]
MKEIKEVRIATLGANRNAAFLAIVENDHLLMAQRKDMSYGFIGGGVEEDEGLRQAVLRELEEETGFVAPHYMDLSLCVSHEVSEGFNTHLYLCCNADRTPHRDTYTAPVMQSFATSEYGLKELNGLVSIPLNYENFTYLVVQAHLAGSTREQLLWLRDNYPYFSELVRNPDA